LFIAKSTILLYNIIVWSTSYHAPTGGVIARLTIKLLGNMQVILDGCPLQGLESAKVHALLAYLAVESEQPHERDHLAGMLWPGVSVVQARQRLSQAIYNLRQSLGEAGKTGNLSGQPGDAAPFILISPHTVQFNPRSNHWLDVKEFDLRITKVRQHSHRRLETCANCARLLLEAEQIYQGEFLSSLALDGCPGFEEWMLVRRERLLRQLCEALSDLVACFEARDELRQGLEAAERWARLDPLSEPALRQTMRLLALDGQRTQALARYHSFRRLLEAELGVEPGRESDLLYQRILAEESTQASLPGMPGLLPVPLSPFIGRDKEIAELTAWLRDPAMRQVTVLGPGGSGKTRLVLQAVRALRYDYLDGIFFVSLSGLSTSDSFLPTLARALGVVFQANWGDPLEQLSGYLQRRHLLLILDSFEEVVGAGLRPAPTASPAPTAATQVTHLLQAAPNLQILVTSRVRLNVQPEQVFHLEGMPYPDPASLEDVIASEAKKSFTPSVRLADYSALQLFHSAARQVRPDYTPTPADLPHVARICQLVDGMPLGLLLAASWLETCTPQEIAAEIEHSLDFLSSSWSDVPARQRSLRATLDYSWRLMEEDECQAFQRLSVFQGAFTRQAAEQVTQVSASKLRDLVDKSMLQTIEGNYRMHDLLRQYAAEKLAADEADCHCVRTAHSAYYLTRLGQYEPRLKSAQRSATLREIDAEINDIQSAWNWACAQADILLLSQSMEGMGLYYGMRVRFSEMKAAFQKAIDATTARPGRDSDTAVLHARLLVWQAEMVDTLGDFDDSAQLRIQAKSLLDQLEAGGIDVRRPLAMYWEVEGDAQANLTTIIECYERSIQLYRAIGDDWNLAGMLNWTGEQALRLGNLDLCPRYQQEALRLARQVGEPNRILACLIDLTYTYFILNQLDEARQLMQEVTEYANSIEELPPRADAQRNLGVQLAWSGRFAEGIDMLKGVLPLLRNLGFRYGYVFGSIALGITHLLIGEYAQGQLILETSFPEAEQGGFPREAASGKLGLGMAALAQGRVDLALEHFRDSIQRYRQMSFKAELGWALGGLALALEADGQADAAQAALIEALQLAEQTRNMFTMITCFAAMVSLLHHRGHLEAALLVERVRLAQPGHRNSRWDADMIGNELSKHWESLPEERRTQIDACASQHTPFSIIPDVLACLT
jgi:DNA-binding SARP family transcriptional activator/predicted ATPase